jgi:hypothetical protein
MAATPSPNARCAKRFRIFFTAPAKIFGGKIPLPFVHGPVRNPDPQVAPPEQDPFSRGGADLRSLIVVWQVRHRKVSKSARSSRDLLACMATPQSGQGRTKR